MKRFSLAFRAPGWLLTGSLVALVTVACGAGTNGGGADTTGGAGSPNDSCEPGSEGCECAKGGGCDHGLTCLSKLCVNMATGGGGHEGGEGPAPVTPVTPVTPEAEPTNACADVGESCLKNGDCCQTGSQVGSQGATCLSDDFACHAKCTANSQCPSGCCAALQGTNFGACSDPAYCAPKPPPSSGCSSDVQCFPSHPTPGCSYTCYNHECVDVCNF